VAVNWYNSPRKHNLHRVWDGLLTHSKLSAKEYAKTLDKLSLKKQSEWQDSTFAEWANESLVLNEQIYDFGAGQDKKIAPLGLWYQEKNRPIADQRLHQAGIRLAFYLNQISPNK
jgi:hypothetical protein